MVGIPINIFGPDAEILADIDHIWEQTRRVPMGEAPDAAAIAAMQAAMQEATAAAALAS